VNTPIQQPLAFPVPMPALVVCEFKAGTLLLPQRMHPSLLAWLEKDGQPFPQLMDRQDVEDVMEALALGLQEGRSGAYRVCAKNLARLTNLNWMWTAICEGRGLRVL
jgi:hypothetical protein